ncbi:mitochondrial carrier [Pyrrhoderma noxium]|uniref:Mitochondrial carrier n=1 Tax=Pyrrhoderma noxium TaxID=2282107 RepID=A0A286U5A9_9AGAM|nr:mitochondrial carrier [Pyrrhoderma noxium]
MATINSSSEGDRKPLLDTQSSPPTYTSQSQPLDTNNIIDSDDQPLLPITSGDNAKAENTILTWKTFRIVIFSLLSIFVLAIFIKGFIDAEDVEFDLRKTLKSALGGGLSGAAAMVLQVLTLMPLRTIMNYQYRYGTSTTEALTTLYADGGFPRYYSGLTFALIQGPISRFGDTAANVGILALLESNIYLKDASDLVKTVFASLAAAGFRMILTPIDTFKTTLQTQGRDGMRLLKARIKANGIGSLWYGAFATAAATFVGHYPWFATYNLLSHSLPPPSPAHPLLTKLLRQAFIGFAASVVSDTASNSLRVLKTYRQVNATSISYTAAAKRVLAADGWKVFCGRCSWIYGKRRLEIR